jgi:hypothetical protein
MRGCEPDKDTWLATRHFPGKIEGQSQNPSIIFQCLMMQKHGAAAPSRT